MNRGTHSIWTATLCATIAAASALDWRQEHHGRSAPVSPAQTGQTGFTLLPPALTGVTFTNMLSPARAAENQIRLNGSGVAAGDVDGDGWCDLYFCGLEGGNRLFRNLGHWRFTDITGQAGVACANQFSTGAALVDIDGDGDLDLLVNGVGVGTRLFLNNGHGQFSESTESGLARRFGSTSLALADIDGDGDLDLYVANYRTSTIRSTGFAVLNVGGKRIIRPQDRDSLEFTPEGLILEHGEADFIYLNDGQGRFTPLPWTGGAFLDESGQPLVKPPRDWALTVAFRDLNHDLAPDLYVANDFHSPDRIWINQGDGRFRALEPLAIRRTPTFSMAVDFADIDRDGYDDFLSLDMLERTHAMRLRNLAMSPPNPPAVGEGADRPQIDRNTLQRNRGDGTFADLAQYAGLDATGWSWSLIFLDVDLDGYEDVLLTTGNLFNTQDLDANARIAAQGPFRKEMIPSKLLMYPPLVQPRLVFRNQGDLTFREQGAQWGFDQVGVAHGMALADLDNDGDLDLIVNNLNVAAGLYRNDCTAPRVAVRLKGAAPNTRGIGARIHVTGGPVPQSQEMIAAGRYLSADDSMRVFGAGAITNDLKIEVAWRSGKTTVIEHAQPNRIYEIDEPVAQDSPRRRSRAAKRGEEAPKPWFRDVTTVLNHTHHEELFDDFVRQPLLPNKLSQLGPGVSWFDLDGDGWDDLIIGSGKGGRPGVLRNDRKGGFTADEQSPFNQRVTRDQTGILAWRDASGEAMIMAGSANYEDGLAQGSSVRQFDLAGQRILDTLPGHASSTGPLAMADFNGDGALDLFVGGRVLPGRYPEPASSLLFRRRGGTWLLDEANTLLLRSLGLVSGALWTDLDSDGLPELVLACEWGALRIFKNDRGKLREVSKEWGVEGYLGWWTGVSAGDFDGDGRMDLVAGNWGLNTPYRASRSKPFRIDYADLNGNGTMDLIEALPDPGRQQWIPWRDLNSVLAAMPWVGEKFESHQAYAEATVAEIYGDKLKQARHVEINTLASMLFLNRGGRFDPAPLPVEAQFAPVFGLAVADFDGDGHEDLFLSQNFFASQPQIPRHDAGRGLLLKGTGAGKFTPVPGHQSGIQVYGEQRGCAAADYDQDGRVDLVVTQNGAPTRLFHNAAAKPGLRVRLIGPPGNPDGIGAALRLRFNERLGPVREVRAGGGYWSQDSPVQVLATPDPPTQLEIRWPGGKMTQAAIPPEARAIEVTLDGPTRILPP